MRVAFLVFSAVVAACAGKTTTPEAHAPVAQASEPPGGDWRFRNLGKYELPDDGLVPCAIAQRGGLVAVVFAGADVGKMFVATNRFLPFFSDERVPGQYWEHSELSDGPLGWVSVTMAGSISILHLERIDEYEVRWTSSMGGPGRWQTPYRPPDGSARPKYPAVTLSPGGAFAVHNDPMAGALDYYGWSKTRKPPPVPVDRDEEIASLLVTDSGDLHAITIRRGKVFHLTNRGDEVVRTVLKSESARAVRGSIGVGPNGSVHVLYRDSNTNGLEYLQRAAAGWRRQRLHASDRAGLANTLRVDPAGGIHVCYSVQDGLRYAHNTTGTWQHRDVVRNSRIDGCDFVLDHDLHPHIGFAQRSTGEFVYATTRPAPVEKTEPSPS